MILFDKLCKCGHPKSKHDDGVHHCEAYNLEKREILGLVFDRDTPCPCFGFRDSGTVQTHWVK